MSRPVRDVARQMYSALNMLPCGCCHKWDRESQTEYTVTKVCTRCLAMKAYETLALEIDEYGDPLVKLV